MDLPHNEQNIYTLRNLIVPMGFSYSVIDSKYSIGLYFWRESPMPVTIYGAEIEKEEGESFLLVMGYVSHLNSNLIRLPRCSSGCGVTVDCSEQELKFELDLLFASVDVDRLKIDEYYGTTSYYENPREIIAEMADQQHGMIIDSYFQD